MALLVIMCIGYNCCKLRIWTMKAGCPNKLGSSCLSNHDIFELFISLCNFIIELRQCRGQRFYCRSTLLRTSSGPPRTTGCHFAQQERLIQSEFGDIARDYYPTMTRKMSCIEIWFFIEYVYFRPETRYRVSWCTDDNKEAIFVSLTSVVFCHIIETSFRGNIV